MEKFENDTLVHTSKARWYFN